jgi:deoxyribose-phosphate aldolase
MQLAQYIDHTILKPTTTLGEIETICNEAVQYQFYSVCIPPYFVKDARLILEREKVKVATVIGFPFGYNQTNAKVNEVKLAISDGAHEVDMVMNLAAFKSNDLAYLENEIRKVTRITVENNVVLKLIIESGILVEPEIIRCCDIFKHFSIDFLKTSTGYAEKGASVEAVQIMRKHLPDHIQIKASGGIRTYEFAKQLVEAGASRLGCSASIAIVNSQPSDDTGY